MKQFFLTLAEDKVSDCIHYLESVEKVKNIAKVHASNGFLLTFSVQQAKAMKILHNLDRFSAGYGLVSVNIVDIEIAKPDDDSTERAPNRLARLTVEEIYANIVSSNQLSFDFLTFLFSSSIIAAGGLATNNAVVVVASMLVSPLMGPILAFSLGGILKDQRLILAGVKNEILSIAGAIFVGVLTALFCIPFAETLGWPTFEMTSRGVPEALFAGIFIAGASGAAVAVAVTSENFASLVGVAISASLLPPAVNTGILFVYAFIGPDIHGSQYTQTQLLTMSAYSFGLLMVNILLINLVGMFFFRLKHVRKVRQQLSIWGALPKLNEDVRAELWHIVQTTPKYHLTNQLSWHRTMSKYNDNATGDVEMSASGAPNYGDDLQKWLTALNNGEITEADIPARLLS